MLERHRWVAVYEGGSRLSQVSQDGTRNAYRDIDRSRLAAFELWNAETGRLAFRIVIEPGDKLVWRRRVEMDGAGEVREVGHLVGRQRKAYGRNATSLFLLRSSDESIAEVSGFDRADPWFYPPDPRLEPGEDIEI